MLYSSTQAFLNTYEELLPCQWDLFIYLLPADQRQVDILPLKNLQVYKCKYTKKSMVWQYVALWTLLFADHYNLT